MNYNRAQYDTQTTAQTRTSVGCTFGVNTEVSTHIPQGLQKRNVKPAGSMQWTGAHLLMVHAGSRLLEARKLCRTTRRMSGRTPHGRGQSGEQRNKASRNASMPAWNGLSTPAQATSTACNAADRSSGAIPGPGHQDYWAGNWFEQEQILIFEFECSSAAREGFWGAHVPSPSFMKMLYAEGPFLVLGFASLVSFLAVFAICRGDRRQLFATTALFCKPRQPLLSCTSTAVPLV